MIKSFEKRRGVRKGVFFFLYRTRLACIGESRLVLKNVSLYRTMPERKRLVTIFWLIKNACCRKIKYICPFYMHFCMSKKGRMGRFYCLILWFVASLMAGADLQAQDAEFYEGMTWYLRKSIALDSAYSQGKQVVMVWGTTTCPNTANVRKRFGRNTNGIYLKSIVDEHYVLWFSNAENYDRFSVEVSDYLSKLYGTISLPVVCIIDPLSVKIAYGLKTGPQNATSLQELLNQFVSNDVVVENAPFSVSTFVSEGQLIIKKEASNQRETVYVYSLAGLLVDTFCMEASVETRDATAYPKGVLVVTGSSGWVRKIIR